MTSQPKTGNEKRSITRRFDIAVTCKKTKSYADGDPNRPWYRFSIQVIPAHMADLVDRVQLELDPSYDVPIRTVYAPFIFSEKAWGQYPIHITVFPKDDFHPPIHVPHLDLILTKSRYTAPRALSFRNLTPEIKEKYFPEHAGGSASAGTSSLGQPPSNNSSSSDLSTTASTPVEATSPRHLSPPPVPAGSTTGQAKNGRKVTGGDAQRRDHTTSGTATTHRPPMSATTVSGRAPVSQSAAARQNTKSAQPPAARSTTANGAARLAGSTALAKRKADGGDGSSPHDPARPAKRMKPTPAAPASSSTSGGGGGVAAMLGIAMHAHPPAKQRTGGPAAAARTGGNKQTLKPSVSAPAPPSSVASILPVSKIPMDRIPRISNPHSAAHALVRSPPPTSFTLPSRPPMSPVAPLPSAAAVDDDRNKRTSERVGEEGLVADASGNSRAGHKTRGAGITVRQVPSHHQQPHVAPPPPPRGSVPLHAGKLRSPPPPTLAAATAGHGTPSRSTPTNPALQLPAKPTFAPPPPPPAASASASAPAGSTPKIHPVPPLHHATPPSRPGGVGGLATAAAAAAAGGFKGGGDPDHREQLKHILVGIRPEVCVELARYLHSRHMAGRSGGAKGATGAEMHVTYDKVGNALVLDVWRMPVEVVRAVWGFVKEKGLGKVE